MSNELDPLKKALHTLRSRQWAEGQFENELEEKLMEQFQSHNTGSRRGRYKTAAVALGAVLICSVGFAAVKLDTIKSWLVAIEINGEVTKVELTQVAPGEPAEATFTIDTDSGQAQVAIQRWDDPSGEQGMQVHVVTGGEDGAAFETMEKVVRRVMSDAQAQNYTLDDIGDAEPAAEWRDQDDNEWKLYLVQGEDGEDASLFTVMYADDAEPLIRHSGRLACKLLAEGAEPKVEVSGDGLITLTFDDGENVNVMKIRTRISAEELADPNTLRVGADCGDGESIRIHVEEIDEN